MLESGVPGSGRQGIQLIGKMFTETKEIHTLTIEVYRGCEVLWDRASSSAQIAPQAVGSLPGPGFGLERRDCGSIRFAKLTDPLALFRRSALLASRFLSLRQLFLQASVYKRIRTDCGFLPLTLPITVTLAMLFQ